MSVGEERGEEEGLFKCVGADSCKAVGPVKTLKAPRTSCYGHCFLVNSLYLSSILSEGPGKQTPALKQEQFFLETRKNNSF